MSCTIYSFNTLTGGVVFPIDNNDLKKIKSSQQMVSDLESVIRSNFKNDAIIVHVLLPLMGYLVLGPEYPGEGHLRGKDNRGNPVSINIDPQVFYVDIFADRCVVKLDYLGTDLSYLSVPKDGEWPNFIVDDCLLFSLKENKLRDSAKWVYYLLPNDAREYVDKYSGGKDICL